MRASTNRASGSITFTPPTPPKARESETFRAAGWRMGNQTEGDMAEQLLLFADELRTRAREILVRAANTDDLEAQEVMHAIAAGYQKLARRVEKRIREAVEA